jgi:hypothetical protein
MPDVKLAGRLPGSVERNGVNHVQPKLIEDGLARRVALIVYDAPTETVDHEEKTQTPKLRVLWIEDMGAEGEAKELVNAMERAAEDRTGRAPLPLDADPDAGDGPELVE